MAHNVSGASLTPIYERLNDVNNYHPLDAETFADWSMEAGDIVTVSRDGKDYASPVHTSTMTWRGKTPIVAINATGKQHRDPPTKVSRQKYARSGAGMRNNQGLYYEVMSEDGILHSSIMMTESVLRTEFNNTASDLHSAIEETAEHIRSEVYTASSQVYSYVNQTASNIRQEVGNEIEDVHSAIEQTASSIRSEVYTSSSQVYSYIQQTASNIRQEVGNEIEDVHSAIEQTASSIRSEVYTSSSQVYSYIQQTASNIRSEVGNEIEDVHSAIEQTASSIRSEVYTSSSQVYSYIQQTASNIRSEVGNAISDVHSSIEQTAEMIRTDVSASNSQLYSYVQQTASGIRQEVANTASDLRSSINQEADRISLVVQGTGSNAKVKAAEIVAGINAQSGSFVKISADKINLSGYVTADELDAEWLTSMIADLEAVNIREAHVTELYIGYEDDDINDLFDDRQVSDITVDGNTLTITYTENSGRESVTFSKAVSLSGEWDGNNYKVTATQNNTQVAIHTSPAVSLNFGAAEGQYYVRAAYNTQSGLVTIGTQSQTYKLGISGSTVQVQDPSGNQIRNTPTLTIAGQYADGWAAAYGKVVIPSSESTTSTFMTVKTPPSTVDGAAVESKYYVTSDNTNVYIRYNGSTGTIVAQGTNGAYGNGQTAGWTAAYGKVSLPSENTSSTFMTVKTPASTSTGGTSGQNSNSYYVTSDNSNVYIRAGSSTGTVVAKGTNGAYANGQAAVTLNNPSWNAVSGATPSYRTVTVTTNGRPTQLSKSVSVYLTAGTWSNGFMPVYIRDGGTSGTVVAQNSVSLADVSSTTWVNTTGRTWRADLTIAGVTRSSSTKDFGGYYTDGVNSVTIPNTNVAWAGNPDGHSGIVYMEATNGQSNYVYIDYFADVTWNGNTGTGNIAIKKDGGSYVNSGAKYIVDATARYNAGVNSVTVPTANITFSGNPDGHSGTIYFSASNGQTNYVNIDYFEGVTWNGNVGTGNIAIKKDGGSYVNSGAKYIVDATARYNAGVTAGTTAGQNAVTINKGSWANGQVTFTKSAGTASTKGVKVALSGSWGSGNDANKYTYTIKDYYDNEQGVSTGYTSYIDASARYTAGVNSVTIPTANITFSGNADGHTATIYISASNGKTNYVNIDYFADVTWNGNTGTGNIAIKKDGGSYVNSGAKYIVDASARYNAGVTAGVNSVTIPTTNVTFAGNSDGHSATIWMQATNGQSNYVYIDYYADVTWNGNTGTGNIAIQKAGGNWQNSGAKYIVDATARYNAGANSVTIPTSNVTFAGNPDGHSATIWMQATNGQSNYVYIDYFSDVTWDGNTATGNIAIQKSGGSWVNSGAKFIVDATDRYNAGKAAGIASVGVSSLSSGYVSNTNGLPSGTKHYYDTLTSRIVSYRNSQGYIYLRFLVGNTYHVVYFPDNGNGWS